MDFSHLTHILIPVARATAEAAAETEKAGGAIGALGINLKLFIAQLINFGVILLVLWKWVFTPVAKKLTERTEKIEKALRDADDTTREKQEFTVWKNQEIAKPRQEASVIITQAQNDSGKVKDEMLLSAKQEQEKVIQQAKKEIDAEKQKALLEVKSEIADMVVLAAEKILRHKLDDKKDQELIKESLKSI